jgi:uncharacterized protein (UPF0210 family)
MSLSIRSVTFFEADNHDYHTSSNIKFNHSEIKQITQQLIPEVRTLRWTLPSIHLSQSNDIDQDLIIANKKSESLCGNGFRWVNQPLNCSNLSLNPLDKTITNSISSLISSREVLFSSLVVDDYDDIFYSSELYTKISKSIARYDTSGFSNFRFGIGYNINPGTPFFPFSFSRKDGFSVAVESFNLINDVWKSTSSYDEISKALLNDLMALNQTCEDLSSKLGIPFLGMDWSLAPLPNSEVSVCGLIEKIANAPMGSPGILSAIERMTQAIKSPINYVKSTGFNGVMLSVLEDDMLASRFSTGHITINDLILYSSVCGCGLDMIPIAGNVSDYSLSNLASDVGSMAFRLKKPLGVRMLTIQGKRQGEPTDFSHDFVTNSVISSL